MSTAVELYFSYQEASNRSSGSSGPRRWRRRARSSATLDRSSSTFAHDAGRDRRVGAGHGRYQHPGGGALARSRARRTARDRLPAPAAQRPCDQGSPPSRSRGKEQLRTSRLALDAVDSGQDFAELARVPRREIEKTYFSPAYFGTKPSRSSQWQWRRTRPLPR